MVGDSNDAAPPPAGDAAVTGVARGALGTGTALDDTQEWILPDDLPAEPVAVGAPDAPPAQRARADADQVPLAEPLLPVAADPAPAVAAASPVAPAASPVVATAPTTRRPSADARRGTSFAATPRAAGLAAAALLALIAVAAVVTSNDNAPANAGGPVVGVTAAPLAPTPVPTIDAAGGNGKDKGGNNGKGNGNGNGNGSH
jgi:hypothetical protein